MITIILFFLIPCILFFKENYEYDNFFESLLISILIGLLFSSFGCAISLIIPTKIIYEPQKYEIESLSDNNQLYGRFYLGIGVVNGEVGYSCYIKYEDHFKMINVKSDRATVRYTDTIPHVVIYTPKMKKVWWNYFSIPVDLEYKYDFFIPEGSITNSYQLDLK